MCTNFAYITRYFIHIRRRFSAVVSNRVNETKATVIVEPSLLARGDRVSSIKIDEKYPFESIPPLSNSAESSGKFLIWHDARKKERNDGNLFVLWLETRVSLVERGP